MPVIIGYEHYIPSLFIKIEISCKHYVIVPFGYLAASRYNTIEFCVGIGVQVVFVKDTKQPYALI
jgi:hypothetical protein